MCSVARPSQPASGTIAMRGGDENQRVRVRAEIVQPGRNRYEHQQPVQHSASFELCFLLSARCHRRQSVRAHRPSRYRFAVPRCLVAIWTVTEPDESQEYRSSMTCALRARTMLHRYRLQICLVPQGGIEGNRISSQTAMSPEGRPSIVPMAAFEISEMARHCGQANRFA